MKYFVVALVVTFYASSIAAQPPLTEKKLQQMVSNTNKAQFAANDSTFLMFHHYSDSATRVQLLNWLNKQSSSSDVYAAARSLSWKAMVLFSAPFRQADVSALMLQAINKAVESGDEYLVVHCLENYGYNCKDNAKPEIALFYFLKAAELRQQLDDRYIFYKNKTAYGMVGETQAGYPLSGNGCRFTCAAQAATHQFFKHPGFYLPAPAAIRLVFVLVQQEYGECYTLPGYCVAGYCKW
jgi:hypothetical protein